MTRLEHLKAMVTTQTSNGNWNYDSYMHGYANGLILAVATMEGKEPEFLEAPKVWLADIPSDGPPIAVGDSK